MKDSKRYRGQGSVGGASEPGLSPCCILWEGGREGGEGRIINSTMYARSTERVMGDQHYTIMRYAMNRSTCPVCLLFVCGSWRGSWG